MRLLLVLAADRPERIDGTVLTAHHLARCYRAIGHQVAILSRSIRASDAPGTSGQASPLWVDATVEPLSAKVRTLAAPRPPEEVDLPEAEAAFASLVDRWRPDYVHIHHLEHLSTRIPAAAAARGLPTVMTLHDFYSVCPTVQLITNGGRICPGPAGGARCARCVPAMPKAVAPLPGRLDAPLRWLSAATGAHRGFFERRHARMQTLLATQICFVAPSRFLAGTLPRAAGHPLRIEVVPNGSDLVWTERPCRAGAAPVVGFMGTLGIAKGAHLLGEALRLLPHLHWHARFHGPASPRYLARCLSGLPPGRAEAPGAYAPESAAALLAEIDVLVVPSLWPENCPLVLLQALSAGVPVVVADWGGLAELVRPGIDGALFAPGSAKALARSLEPLLADPARIIAFNQRLRTRPRRTWDMVAEDYLRLFEMRATVV